MDEPVDRQLHAGGHVRCLPADLQRGIRSRGPDLFDERVGLGEVGDGLQGSAGVLTGVLAGALAQHAEESAGIGQRAPPRVRHALAGTSAL